MLVAIVKTFMVKIRSISCLYSAFLSSFLSAFLFFNAHSDSIPKITECSPVIHTATSNPTLHSNFPAFTLPKSPSYAGCFAHMPWSDSLLRKNRQTSCKILLLDSSICISMNSAPSWIPWPGRWFLADKHASRQTRFDGIFAAMIQ